MALNIQALANYLAKNPKSLQNALSVTQFANQKLQNPQQIMQFLRQHPNAANRMGKHLQRAVPDKDLGFGVDVNENNSTQNPAAQNTKAEQLFVNPDTSGMTGGQQKGINQAAAVGGIEQNANIANQYGQIGEFGGSQTVKEDAAGNVTVERELGDAAKGIAAADERISGAGRGISESILRNKAADFEAGFNPNLTARTTTGDINKDRARIEEEVFGRYTKDLDQNYERDKQKLEAELLSRGVPLTPESTQYQRAMEEMNKRYDNQRLDARQRAVEKGGEEFSRSFGIGEQLRGNELSEQSGIRSQQIGEASAFAGMGPGVRQDQFTQYNPYQLDLPDPTAIKVANTGLRQGQQGIDINRQQVENQAKSQAEQLAIQREQLQMAKDQQAKAEDNSWIEGARTADVGVPGPGNTGATAQPQQQAAVETAALSTSNTQPAATATPAAQPAAPVPAWSAATDKRGLANQQARIEKRIAEGRAVDPAEAQRRLAAVKKAQRRM